MLERMFTEGFNIYSRNSSILLSKCVQKYKFVQVIRDLHMMIAGNPVKLDRGARLLAYRHFFRGFCRACFAFARKIPPASQKTRAGGLGVCGANAKMQLLYEEIFISCFIVLCKSPCH